MLPINVMAVSASLSARRAWIEMLISVLWMALSRVALRKESVDRNGISGVDTVSHQQSLSARRAWIEIFMMYH